MPNGLATDPRRRRLSELARLQVRHIDAANGYEAGIERADGQMRPVLEDLAALHRQLADESARILTAHGGEPDPDGSWMSLVHGTVMTARGLFDGLDSDVIPALVNGETRILEQIGTVLGQDLWTDQERRALIGQRDRIEAEIAALKAREDDADG